MPTAYESVPPRTLGRVMDALHTLHRWNRLIMDARATEGVSRQPGRYECYVRYHAAGASHRMALVRAQDFLTEQFEPIARTNGVDPEAVYHELGGKPALLEEGKDVSEWRQR
jgi:hypothetical protein